MKSMNTVQQAQVGTSWTHAAAVSQPDIRRARLARVDEYEVQGTSESAAFDAMMAVVQADLFRAACFTEDAAKQALLAQTAVESISDVESKIDRHLRVVRRIARNAQLTVRARSTSGA